MAMKIVIVDDNLSIRKVLAALFESNGHQVVATLEDGEGLSACVEQHRPDLVCLDYNMPGKNGLQLLHELHASAPHIDVVIITGSDDPDLVGRAAGAGACGFLRKPFSQRLLIERVKALLRRTGADGGEPESAAESSAKAIKRGKLSMDPARHESTWEGRPVKLTVTEFLLLQALAQRPGFVKSRDNLMDAAYDDQVYVDDRTIDSHVKRMRKKFRVVDPEFDAIETLYGVGYRYRES